MDNLLTPEQLRRCAADLDRINSLDQFMESLGRAADSLDACGEAVRRSLGQNRMHAAPADGVIGELVRLALIRWALKERGKLAKGISSLVLVPVPPFAFKAEDS